ncbi:MAG TPA: type II toxin-antitoxin system PemK/MazF family toxin [Opitutaceae bacterium]|nr:type II toxin-antitoxin system PemK/MazF family toxin [Opitutaceae bacterium]
MGNLDDAGDEQDPHGHPLIVLSNDDSCADAKRASINVLFGSTKRPGIGHRPFEIVCDEANGCEKATVIDCSRIYFIAKEKLGRQLGTVSRARWAQARRKIAEVFRFLFQ